MTPAVTKPSSMSCTAIAAIRNPNTFSTISMRPSSSWSIATSPRTSRWVAAVPYNEAWPETVCVAFIIDVFFRTILGRRAATSNWVLDVLEHAIWACDQAGVVGGATLTGDLACRSPGERLWRLVPGRPARGARRRIDGCAVTGSNPSGERTGDASSCQGPAASDCDSSSAAVLRGRVTGLAAPGCQR